MAARSGSFGGWVGMGLVALLLAVFLAGPLLVVLTQGLSPVVLHAALANPVYREGLANAFLVATVTTALALVIAVPLAWLSSRYRFRGQRLLEAVLLAPLVLPPFVGALGIYQLLGEYGIVNSLLAHLGGRLPGPDWMGNHRFAIVCAVEALGLYPILYLLTVAAFRRLDASLIEAAQASGASWTQVAWRIVLPLARPALFSGGVLVFVWSFTELGTPLMLGYTRITPVQVWMGLNELAANRVPYALVVVMLLSATAIYLLGRWLFAGRYDAQIDRSSHGAEQVLRGGAALAAAAPYVLVAGLAVLPHLVVLLVGLTKDWYGTVLPRGWTWMHVQEALSHPQVVPGILNSLRYSLAATALALAIGTFIAWVGVRWRPWGWRALDAAAMVPLAVPGIIFAFGYLGLGVAIGHGLDPTKNPAPLLIIAYSIRRLPQVVRAVAAGLAQTPVVLEEAAAVAGASRARSLARITFPLIGASLAAAALLTFSASMLEVSDSMVLAMVRSSWPITRVIFDLLNALGSGPAIACAFAGWAMLFLICCLAGAAVLLGRRLTSLFRS